MSLRARLAWTFGVTVAIALLGFALVSTVMVDRTLRSSLDGQLATTAGAIATLVDIRGDGPALEQDDQGQFQLLLGTSMDAAILLPNGTMLAASSARLPLAIERNSRRVRASFLATTGSGERAIRYVIVPILRKGIWYGNVVVWRGSDWIDAFDRTAVIATTMAAFLVGGIVIVLSSLLVRRALAPLESMSEVAQEIEAHDLGRRLGMRGRDELGRLAAAFDRMLDRIEAAFARQKRFTADASHELRAPLAVIRAEADLALRSERSSAQYRLALGTIADEVERLDDLVAALLASARADADSTLVEEVELGALTRNVILRFQPRCEARGVQATVEVTQAVWIEGDSQSIERALAAVVHNAIEIAIERVRVSVGTHAGEGIICVVDDGPGFSADALVHARERFWRGTARTRGGSGLGLSIADAIARAQKGGIDLENAADGGAQVRLRFPVHHPVIFDI